MKLEKLLDKANKYTPIEWATGLWKTKMTLNVASTEINGYETYNNKELINKMVTAIANSIDFKMNENGYAEEIIEFLKNSIEKEGQD